MHFVKYICKWTKPLCQWTNCWMMVISVSNEIFHSKWIRLTTLFVNDNATNNTIAWATWIMCVTINKMYASGFVVLKWNIIKRLCFNVILCHFVCSCALHSMFFFHSVSHHLHLTDANGVFNFLYKSKLHTVQLMSEIVGCCSSRGKK